MEKIRYYIFGGIIMKIKEFVKKNRRVIKSLGEYNALAYAGRRISRVLSEEELTDVRKRIIESRMI